MRKLILIQIMIVTLGLLVSLTACSGGGGEDTVQTSNTTWDDLIWDDGVNENTRKWAD